MVWSIHRWNESPMMLHWFNPSQLSRLMYALQTLIYHTIDQSRFFNLELFSARHQDYWAHKRRKHQIRRKIHGSSVGWFFLEEFWKQCWYVHPIPEMLARVSRSYSSMTSAYALSLESRRPELELWYHVNTCDEVSRLIKTSHLQNYSKLYVSTHTSCF